MTEGRDERGRFAEGNAAAEKHGHERAVKALTSGADLRGLAANLEEAARVELATHGRRAILERNALRLQAVSDLFYGLLLGAMERGEVDDVDRFTRRFGWLTGSAQRAWEQVAKESDPDADVLDAAITEARSVKDANNQTD